MSILGFVPSCNRHTKPLTKHFFRSYRGLSSKARLGSGVGLLAWGAIGLYLSDRAEEKFGFKPSDQDNEELEKYTPKIHVIDKGSK